jgi:predicted membrane protein
MPSNISAEAGAATLAASARRQRRAWARGLTLLAGSAIALTLFVYPLALGPQMGPREHTALPILLMGVSAAFVHGLGFEPETRLARWILGPVAAWIFIVSGVALLALPRLG